MGEPWTATWPTKKAWAFRSAQVLVIGVALVQVYVAMPRAARAQPVEIAGRSLLRPRPSRPSQHGLVEGRWAEEKGEDEKHRVKRRRLEHADVAVKLELIERTRMPECPVVQHQPNSMPDDSLRSTITRGTAEVWAKLQLAVSAESCQSEGECCRGKHIHTYRGGDLGEEMSHIRGAVVVRRPDLTEAAGSLAPAHDLDFVRTLQSYFPTSRDSLLSRMVEAKAANKTAEEPVGPRYPTLLDATSFLEAVGDGDPAAGELLTAYCDRAEAETPRRAIADCLRVPTVVSMADVHITTGGYIWNEDDYVVPISCASHVKGEEQERAHAAALVAGISLKEAKRYEKVFIMSQEWGPNWYHFTVEHLPRIMAFLDVLLENDDIKIAVHHHGHDKWHDTGREYDAHLEMLAMLGIRRERILLVKEEIHADLAILPTSTVCGDPDTHLINMLRHRLLQGMYPGTGGVPPLPPRPTIVLIVRNSIRGLQNNDEVREALEDNFPDYDVVEFFGTGSVQTQFEAFTSASLIVAPHGAGLSNTIVAPLHTAVLEIAPIQCPPCFLRLTLKLHHIYARHTGGEWNMECNNWYEPDVDDIVRLSRDLLEAKREADEAGHLAVPDS
eukprot:g14266.t1